MKRLCGFALAAATCVLHFGWCQGAYAQQASGSLFGQQAPPSMPLQNTSLLPVEIITITENPTPLGSMADNKLYFYQIKHSGQVYECIKHVYARGPVVNKNTSCGNVPEEIQLLGYPSPATGPIHDEPPTSSKAVLKKLYFYRQQGVVYRCVPMNGAFVNKSGVSLVCVAQ